MFYVISTPQGYVEYTQIEKGKEEVKILSVTYTDDLNKAQQFSEEEYTSDLPAWERYLKIKEGYGFIFLKAKLKITLA